jgi:peroxiredoxin
MTLLYLQEQLPNIQLKGASLLALTPELPDRSISTTEKHQLQFEVLSDVGNKVANNMVSFLS